MDNNELDPRTIVFPKWPKAFDGLTEEQCERVMAWHSKQMEEAWRENIEERRKEKSRLLLGIIIVAALFLLSAITK